MDSKDNFLNLKKYQIIYRIGQGSFSTVFRIKNLETNEYYAAKVSKFMADDENEEVTKSLFREINLMALLNHPSILKFIGYSPVNNEGHLLPTIVKKVQIKKKTTTL